MTNPLIKASLVAFYGKKAEPLSGWLDRLQQWLSRALPDAFTAYASGQVHATLIGMESTYAAGKLYSRWCRENHGQTLPVDLAGFLNTLRAFTEEITIQLGGYHKQRDYNFSSRGAPPFERSFSIQDDTALTVGWPVALVENGSSTSEALFTLRQSFERHHLCHKWHRHAYRDNDCFMVLGRVDRSKVRPERLAAVVEETRYLMAADPCRVRLNREKLSIAVYAHPELPPASTRILRVGKGGWSENGLIAALRAHRF